MLCQSCKKREAVVHFYSDSEYGVFERALCINCLKKINYKDLNNTKNFEDDIDSKMDIKSIVDMIITSNEKKNKKIKNNICNSCGMSEDEVVKTGYLGCQNCYKIFEKHIISKLLKRNNNNIYEGKIPKNLILKIEKRKKLDELKKELEIAIVIEAYEKAAKIRDEINKLELSYSEEF